jgi:uncharacterized protein with HEPN domain
MRRDEASLLDAAKFANNILELMEGIDQSTLETDLRTQSAVLYQLTILGEAIKRLSPGFREQHPDIPWRKIAGTRDKVTHQYDRVDFVIVWEVVQRDIPAFLAQLTPLLPVEEA